MTDEELIRRGDALAAVQGFEYGWHAEDVIAALPASHDPAAIREAAIRECACALRKIIDYALFAGADPDEIEDAAINSYADYLLTLIPKSS